MRFADPYALKIKPTRETVIFAASQHIGTKTVQCDYFLNFNDECFVLADGLDSLPHSAVAAKFACETAVWAYKHIRQHRYYWMDKKLFMKRIFRSTNLAVWQKKKEAGYEAGMATSLMVLIIGAKQYWLGSAGPVGAWHIHGGTFTKLTPDIDPLRPVEEQQYLGIKRLGLMHAYKTAALNEGETIIMASSGCGNYLTPTDISTAAAMSGKSTNDATAAIMSLVQASGQNGSTENQTGVLIKRLERA